MNFHIDDDKLPELRDVLNRAMNTWEPTNWPRWLIDLEVSVEAALNGGDDEPPTIDGQFADLMDGIGASDDHNDMRSALASLGLQSSTIEKMMPALAWANMKPAFTPPTESMTLAAPAPKFDHEFFDRDDGLLHCRICGGAEGSLPTDCVKSLMTSDQNDAVHYGEMDYVGGKWLALARRPIRRSGLVERVLKAHLISRR